MVLTGWMLVAVMFAIFVLSIHELRGAKRLYLDEAVSFAVLISTITWILFAMRGM